MLTIIQMMLLAQTSHSGLTIHTVDLLYVQYTGLHGVPVCYDIQSNPTSTKTLSPLVFGPQDKEDKLHPQAKKKRPDTRQNRHWLMQCRRIQCHVCSTKTETEWNKNEIQVLRMQYKVVCHPKFWGKSHQIIFLRINWYQNGKVKHTSISKYPNWN
jgi:hypothetical protein